ncbi:UNVERIFIED_CONTAM: hypothetical protein RMT77_002762 [Armadillidium vulgare]
MAPAGSLMPLEFKDCLTDSPEFRKKLQSHEKELDRTSQAIKSLTKEIKNLVEAAKNLSIAQKNLMSRLKSFAHDPNQANLTEDEVVISQSFNAFAQIIKMVEEERQRMLDRAEDHIIGPLEAFRKDAIGGAKERRKKFEKQTQKFYQSQERYLNLSTKKDDQVLQEADASLDMEHRHFVQASLEYVFLLQEVQERKKFEFVEIILSHTYSWLTFYHQGHEVYNDYKNYMTDLQQRIQRTRENFNATRQEAELLKNKMSEIQDPGSMNRMFTRQGYLYLMEKKAFGTTNWTKYYCYYQKETKEFRMIPYNQIQQKLEMTLKSCVRRSADSIDKRFCLDLTVQMHDKEKGPTLQVLTMQTLSEEDCKRWMDAMDGKEPIYACPSNLNVVQKESTLLDEFGLNFISKAIAILESKGLEDQGLYRLVGVSSKVTKLLNMGLDPNKADKLVLEDPAEWEVKTITSAIKQYFRTLPEPLMTYELHNDFIAAAKKANAEKKEKEKKERKHINLTHQLVHKLPETNFKVLKTLIQHLCNVAKKSDKNLMTVSNLGVCFGPTLLRPEEESVAAIMDIKFCNIVVEILIEHFDTIFNTVPPSPLELLPSEGPLKQNSLPSGSSSSTPKSSPTPTAHSPSGGSTSNNQHLSQGVPPLKANQPVLQTVVTSFTTSEPQTVHFGNQQQQSQHQQQASSTPGMLRSEATSNLKNQSGSHANHQLHHSHYHHSNRPPGGGGGGGVPPPPSSTHIWPHGGHSASTSSLNSGLVSQTSLTSLTSGVGSLYDVVSSSNNNINLSNNNPLRASTRPSGPTNGRLGGGPLSFVNPLSDRGEGVGSSSSSCESLSSRSSRDLPLPLPHPPQPAPTTSLSSSSSPQTSKRLQQPPPPVPHHHYLSSHHPSHFHHPFLHNGEPTTPQQRGERIPPSQHHHHHFSSLSSATSSSARLGTAYPPTYKQHMETLCKRQSLEHLYSSIRTSLSGSQSSSALPTLASVCASSTTSVLTGTTTANGIASVLPRKRVRTLYACVGENDSELSFEPNQILTNVRPSKEPGWLEGTLNGRHGLIPENYVEYIDDKGSLPTLISQRNTDV